MISRHDHITMLKTRWQWKLTIFFQKVLKMTMIEHHYGGFIHDFLLQALILLSYLVFPVNKWEKTKIKMSDVCINTHIMCFWRVLQHFSSYLNNHTGFQCTIYHRISKKKISFEQLKCSGWGYREVLFATDSHTCKIRSEDVTSQALYWSRTAEHGFVHWREKGSAVLHKLYNSAVWKSRHWFSSCLQWSVSPQPWEHLSLTWIHLILSPFQVRWCIAIEMPDK